MTTGDNDTDGWTDRDQWYADERAAGRSNPNHEDPAFHPDPYPGDQPVVVFPFGLTFSDIGLLMEMVHLGVDQHWSMDTDGLDRINAAGVLKTEMLNGHLTYVLLMPRAGIFLDRRDVAEVIRAAFATHTPFALRKALAEHRH